MRVKGILSYDGSSFHGYAINSDVRTVAGELDSALTKVLREKVAVTCAGRTDRGVHAQGQVISFDTPQDTDLGKLQNSINRICRPHIVINNLSAAPPEFDARFSATGRCYRYRILNQKTPNPFLAATTWHVPTNLNLEKMVQASNHFLGTHDFSSFCKRTSPQPGYKERSLVRTVQSVTWSKKDENVIEFEIFASSFCHQMVRSIVGTIVRVGKGHISEKKIPEILAACDRQGAGSPAPPHGLILWSVQYPDFNDDLERVAETESAP